jgi:hypothetical protein
LNAEDYRKIQKLIAAVEKHIELSRSEWGSVLGNNLTELYWAVIECKRIDWAAYLDSTEISGSIYAPWKDITVGSGTRLVDCISTTELPVVDPSPEQIK